MGIIEGISLLCEMLALLLVLHKYMGRKFRLDVHTVFFLIVDIVLYRLIGMRILSGSVQILVYIMFCVYLGIHFKGEKFLKMVAGTVISIFFVSGIQLALNLVFISIQNVKIRILLMEIVSFLIVLFGVNLIDVWRDKLQVYKYNDTLGILVIGCGIMFIVLMFLCKFTGFSILNNLLAAMILFIVLIFCQQWKVEKERNLLQEREIRVLKQCNESFEHLIKEVRSRQHEFDNQIETIYSLQYVTDTYEELVTKQNEYAAHIIKGNSFNNLLRLECSSIIKGFLYYKFSLAQKSGIDIDYEIKLKKFNAPSVEFDIQEIFGILFDNACEALTDGTKTKIIYVRIIAENDNVNIQVENPAEYLNQKQIQYYLKPGNSSKGLNRGLGLSNVKAIAKKYASLLEIQNVERAEQNWIVVSVLLNNVNNC